MNYNKICINNEESDDETDDDILVRKLPVASFDDYDASVPPSCGEDYLRRVQIEAQKCPKIVVANLDVAKFNANQTVVINGDMRFIPAKSELSSIEWQRQQIADFTNVRLKLSRYKSDSSRVKRVSIHSLPKYRSMSWWKEHCIGKKSDDGSSTSECESPNESSYTDTPKSTASLPSNGEMPLLSTVCDLSQEEIQRVIEYHIKWIKQFGFKPQNGLWLYSLLALLEKPLPSEVYSILRELSRVCSEVRSKMKSPDNCNILIPLNLIICIIGRYFDQYDMVDE